MQGEMIYEERLGGERGREEEMQGEGMQEEMIYEERLGGEKSREEGKERENREEKDDGKDAEKVREMMA